MQKLIKHFFPILFVVNLEGDRILGSYSSGGNGGWCWFEYDAMILLGKPAPVEDVIRYYDCRKTTLFGTFGVNPIYIPGYYLEQGFTSKHNTVPFVMPSNIEDVAKSASACILLYAHSSGAHYVAMKWNGNSYKVYNDNVNSVSSIKEYMSAVGGTFVTIWCID